MPSELFRPAPWFIQPAHNADVALFATPGIVSGLVTAGDSNIFVTLYGVGDLGTLVLAGDSSFVSQVDPNAYPSSAVVFAGLSSFVASLSWISFIAWDLTHPIFGTRSLRIVTLAANQGAQWTLPLLASTTYTTSVFVYSIAGGESAQLQVNAYRSPVFLLQAGKQRLSFSFTTGAGEASGAHALVSTSPAPMDIWADGFQTEVGGIASPYIETSTVVLSRPAGRARLPVGRADPGQGALLTSLRLNFPSTDITVRSTFCLYQDANNYIRCFWDGAGHFITETKDSGVILQAVSAVQTFTAGTVAAILPIWTSSGPGISVGGAAFIRTGGRGIPFTSPVSLDVGSHNGTQQIGADIFWAIGLLGTSTDIDAQIWNGLANSKPTAYSIGSASKPFAIWLGVDSSYQVVTIL